MWFCFFIILHNYLGGLWAYKDKIFNICVSGYQLNGSNAFFNLMSKGYFFSKINLFLVYSLAFVITDPFPTE